MTWYKQAPAKRILRWKLFYAQDGRCVYCSRGMSMHPDDWRKARHATLDHLEPLALGGTNGHENLVLCCRICNQVKGHSTLEEFVFGLLWVWLWKNMPVLTWQVAHRMPDREAA